MENRDSKWAFGLGFGAAPIGNAKPPKSSDEALVTLDAAYAAGIRYFDTAPLYGSGLSEQLLASFLATKPRSDVTLSTKVGRLIRDGEAVYDYSYDGIMYSVEESLDRLGIETLDIAYIHDIGIETHGPEDHANILNLALDGGYAALSRLRDEGVIDKCGIGVNETTVCLEVLNRVPLDYVLLAGRYTLLEQSALETVLPCAEQYATKVIAGAPFNSGILVTGPVARATHNYGIASSAVLERVSRIAGVCTDFDVPLAAAALQFPLAHPSVDCVLCGMEDQHQVEQCVAWLDTKIPMELWDTLKRRNLLHSMAPVPRFHENSAKSDNQCGSPRFLPSRRTDRRNCRARQ